MKKIQFLQETEQGSGVYGANHLADISEEEFKRDYLGINLEKVNPAKSLIGREWMGCFHYFEIQSVLFKNDEEKMKNETTVLKRSFKNIVFLDVQTIVFLNNSFSL